MGPPRRGGVRVQGRGEGHRSLAAGRGRQRAAGSPRDPPPHRRVEECTQRGGGGEEGKGGGGGPAGVERADEDGRGKMFSGGCSVLVVIMLLYFSFSQNAEKNPGVCIQLLAAAVADRPAKADDCVHGSCEGTEARRQWSHGGACGSLQESPKVPQSSRLEQECSRDRGRRRLALHHGAPALAACCRGAG